MFILKMLGKYKRVNDCDCTKHHKMLTPSSSYPEFLQPFAYVSVRAVNEASNVQQGNCYI